MNQILYVDDEANWRDMVGETLRAVGHEVLTAGDATEAMEKQEGARLGLIILDLNLAGESGLMLMKFFKRNQPGIPIILYTGMENDQEKVRNMLLQGAAQYLRKGSMTELVQAVARSFRND